MSKVNADDTRVSRRKFLLTSGAIGAAGLAGCSSSEGDGGDDSDGGDSSDSSDSSGGSEVSLLNAEGSSTVYPISNKGSSYWNANAPPSDGEYWGSNEESTVPGWSEFDNTDMNLADYFASLYGFSRPRRALTHRTRRQ
jgi:phosphate transport system substrate-binding protein